MCRPLATAFQHDDFSPVPGNKGPLATEKKRVPEPRRTGVAVDGNVLRKVWDSPAGLAGSGVQTFPHGQGK